MESHEEKLALMIKQSKMDSAKDQAARQAKAIKERQRELVSLVGQSRTPGAHPLLHRMVSHDDVFINTILSQHTQARDRLGSAGGRSQYQGIGGGGDSYSSGGYDGGGCKFVTNSLTIALRGPC